MGGKKKKNGIRNEKPEAIIFPISPIFDGEKAREGEIDRDGRDVDTIRERRHVLGSSASRFLTRLCIYRSGGKVGSKRLRLRNTSCNRIRTSFPVVLGRQVGRTIWGRFERCCALFFMFHYVPALLLSWHRTAPWASSTRKSLPESLNVPLAFQTRQAKTKRSANNLKNVSTYSDARASLRVWYGFLRW